MNWLNCERPKKSRITAEKRLRIDELLRRHLFDRLIEQRHALLHETFRTSQTDAALVGEQFAHRTDAPAAQVINVVQRTFALFERSKYFVASTKSSLVRMRDSFLFEA
jgi:hypothetical protein